MALLILTSNESVGVSSGTYTVVGTRDGKETVTVAPGAKVTLDASFNAGGDSIAVSGNAGSYKAVSDGTQVILTDALGGTVTIPVGTTKSTVAFADASRDLVISGGALKLGNDTVGTTATTVTAGTGGTTPVVGQTFTLTTGSNNLTGTSADDYFDASLSSGGLQTLNAFDSIVGGLGNDSLFASVNTGNTAVRISGVEALTFQNVSSGASSSTVDLLNSSGYTSVENNSSVNPLSITNIASTASGAKISNTSSSTTFAWVGTAVAGLNDTISLTLSNATGGNTNGAITIAQVENVNVVSTDGPNSVGFANVDASAIVVSGNQNLALGTLNPLTASLNASSATGSVTATFGAVATATVTGGTGNDSFSMAAVTGKWSVAGGAGDDTVAGGVLVIGDSVDGGSGNDTVTLTAASLGTFTATTPTTYGLTSVERLSVVDTATSVDGLIVLTNASTSVDTLGIAISGAPLVTGGNDTIQGAAGSLTLNLGGEVAGTTNGLIGGALVVRSTGTAANDSLTLNNRATNSATKLNVDVFNNQSVTDTGYENVSISTGTVTSAVTDTINVLTITADTAASPVSLTLTGRNASSISSVATNSTGLLTINASGLTTQASGTTLTISATSSGTGGTQSITGSAGNDTISAGATATIDGGAGNDNITGSSGNDSILGGDGVDTINAGAGNDTVLGGAGNDSITAGSGNDSLSGGDGDDVFVLAGNLTSADTIDGGAGTNTLSVTASATLSSAAFANVTNITQVGLTGNTVVSLAAPLAAGGTTFDLSEATLGNQLTFAPGFTGSATVLETNGTAGNAGIQDIITNTANIALTVQGKGADINNVQVQGGTGVDALVITADGNATVTNLTNMSSIDTITMVAGTDSSTVGATVGALSETLSNAKVASGATLTVNASAMAVSTASFGFSGTAGQLGGVNVTGAAAAANTINVSAFAGNNTVTGGSGADVITAGTGNDSLVGNAGNDSFVMGANLTAADTIDGGAGTGDTLSATINGLAAATTGALQITGVETLNFNTATANSTINAAGIVGATRINVGDSLSVTFTNLAANTNFGLGVGTGTTVSTGYSNGTLTFSLANSSGSSDAVTVNLTNSTSAPTVNATLAAAAGIETITIAASSGATASDNTASATANSATLNVSGLITPSLVISGGALAAGTASTATLVLTGGTTTLSTTTTSLNASSYSGILTAAASSSATTFTTSGLNADNLTGGIGNDTFTINAAGVISTTNNNGIAYAINGGEGTDTLNLVMGSAATGLNLSAVSAIENFAITLPNNLVVTNRATAGSSVAGLNTTSAANVVVTGGTSLSGLTIDTAFGGTGFKSFDASAVTGIVDVTVTAPNTLVIGDVVRGGSGTSDVIRYAVSSVTPLTAATISGFETIVVDTASAAGTQSLLNTTGLTKVAVSGSNNLTLTDMPAGVTIDVGQSAVVNTLNGGSAGSLVALGDGRTITATLASNSGTADTQNVNLVSAGTSPTAGLTLNFAGVETINLNQSSTIAAPAFLLSLADTNTNAVTVNLTGGVPGTNAGVTFLSSGLPSSVTVLNAGSFGNGPLVMNSGSRLNANAMTITGSVGNDTIIMRNTNDSLTGGTGTDTLALVSNSGGFTVVDLSSATDQVTQFGGAINSAIQSGFEYLDLSGITTASTLVTGRTGANSIVGGFGNDEITTGSANDTVTGGAGGDTINVGSGTDTVRYTAFTDTARNASGATNLAPSGTEITTGTGIDLITGMGRGDVISLAGTALGTLAAFNTTVSAGTTAFTNESNAAAPVALVRGTYLYTGVFSVAATGADLLLQWDSNGASNADATSGVQAVVLIGSNTGFVSGGASNGAGTANITGVFALSAGALTLV